MARRYLAAVLWLGGCGVLVGCAKVENKPVPETPVQEFTGPSVQYVPGNAPKGMSEAVIVKGLPLAHTRQILPVGRDGKLVGEDSLDKQIEQVLTNLEAVLASAGSGLSKLVRLNIYANSTLGADRTRTLLSQRLDAKVRPAISVVLSPLPHRKALVAADAVAVAAERGASVVLQRCETVAGDRECADVAVMPRGGVVYLSGQPEKGALPEAAAKSISTLLGLVGQLKLKPADVVQVKVFIKPATSADAALREVKKLFPGQFVPPVVFVEWIASAPVEIELLACLPLGDKAVEGVEYYNPPDVTPSPAFSRAALVRSERQVYISGLYARSGDTVAAQARDVFEQLQSILNRTGGDMQHLAKATYYVSEDEMSDAFNAVRSEFFDAKRPPAASKVTVHGVGRKGGTLTMDMIAVGKQ